MPELRPRKAKNSTESQKENWKVFSVSTYWPYMYPVWISKRELKVLHLYQPYLLVFGGISKRELKDLINGYTVFKDQPMAESQKENWKLSHCWGVLLLSILNLKKRIERIIIILHAINNPLAGISKRELKGAHVRKVSKWPYKPESQKENWKLYSFSMLLL